MIKNLFRKTILLTTSFILTVGLVPNINISSNQKLNITTNNKEQKENDEILYNIDIANGEFELELNNLSYNFKNKYELDSFIKNQIEIKNRPKEEQYWVENLDTNEDLEEYSRKFLQKYDLELNVLVEFNNDKEEGVRGTFYYDLENHESLYIDINTDLLDCLHEVERTLRHELTHMALFELGRNFDDNEEDFESENYINGGRSNSDTRQPLPLDSRVKNNYCCD